MLVEKMSVPLMPRVSATSMKATCNVLFLCHRVYGNTVQTSHGDTRHIADRPRHGKILRNHMSYWQKVAKEILPTVKEGS